MVLVNGFLKLRLNCHQADDSNGRFLLLAYLKRILLLPGFSALNHLNEQLLRNNLILLNSRGGGRRRKLTFLITTKYL